MSQLQLLLRPAKRNLVDVVSKLPQLGVGARVARASWQPYGDSYWDVTAVRPADDAGKTAKVWGVLTWRGVREDAPRQINGRAKKVWRWVPPPEEARRLLSLAQELQRREGYARAAAAGGGGGAGAAAAAGGGDGAAK